MSLIFNPTFKQRIILIVIELPYRRVCHLYPTCKTLFLKHDLHLRLMLLSSKFSGRSNRWQSVCHQVNYVEYGTLFFHTLELSLSCDRHPGYPWKKTNTWTWIGNHNTKERQNITQDSFVIYTPLLNTDLNLRFDYIRYELQTLLLPLPLPPPLPTCPLLSLPLPLPLPLTLSQSLQLITEIATATTTATTTTTDTDTVTTSTTTAATAIATNASISTTTITATATSPATLFTTTFNTTRAALLTFLTCSLFISYLTSFQFEN